MPYICTTPRCGEIDCEQSASQSITLPDKVAPLTHLPPATRTGYAGGMTPPSKLDDPAIAQFAWARYRRLMVWMVFAAFASATVALSILYIRNPGASIHLFIAAAAGIFLSVLLGAALMGLVFLSAGTGHDAAIDDRLERERNEP